MKNQACFVGELNECTICTFAHVSHTYASQHTSTTLHNNKHKTCITPITSTHMSPCVLTTETATTHKTKQIQNTQKCMHAHTHTHTHTQIHTHTHTRTHTHTHIFQAMYPKRVFGFVFAIQACFKVLTLVGFEPTQPALVDLESTQLDPSGKVSLFRELSTSACLWRFHTKTNEI